MFLSKYFLPIVKDTPKDAQIISHRLMLRSGMIKQDSAGIYSWLPLGQRVLKKISSIIVNEQNNAGAHEILMPTIQSAELWRESGRYDDYGLEMLRIKDRHDRDVLYGPTNEEMITDIFRSHIKSYRGLPLNLYHIQWKFRDEIRPRFGVMRGREFLMKDAYSFDLDQKNSFVSYNKMFISYLKIFKKLGLTAIPMEADTGPIGGDKSHEFIILADTGESKVYCDKKWLNLTVDIDSIDYEKDLESNVNLFTSLYAATDEKHDPTKIDALNLLETRGIEVGHIFQLGQKYSEKMSVSIKDSSGKGIDSFMGCYGIGVSRIVAAAIEQNHDDKGIIWPYAIAPFHVNVICLDPKKEEVLKECESVYQIIKDAGHDVLLDDRDIRAGQKFTDNEILGVPFSIVIGPKNFSNNSFEFVIRKTNEKLDLNIDEIKQRLEEEK